MELQIKSRKLDQVLTFSIPGSGYIYVDANGKEGTLGNQICQGGSLSGSTISYSGGDQKEFERICKNWYRSYMSKA